MAPNDAPGTGRYSANKNGWKKTSSGKEMVTGGDMDTRGISGRNRSDRDMAGVRRR